MNKSKKYYLIPLLTCLGLLPIGLYFYKFHYGLAEVHSKWGEFGSFLSPFVGLLAFVGVLYSIEITKKQFKRQSEETGFFSLLNIHIQNVEQLFHVNSDVTGDVFKFYANEYAKIFRNRCYYFAREAIIYDLNKISEFGFRFLYSKITHEECFHAGENEIEVVLNYFEKNKKDKDEALKMLVDGNSPEEDKDKMKDIGALYFEDSTAKFRIDKMALVYERFDDLHGHQMSKYFQYIYCVLDYLDRVHEKEKYIRIFKSQFSRNEIILIYYNTTNSETEKKFNRLIFKYGMLDNIFSSDLCYTAHNERLDSDLKEIKGELS